jgi:hypothetical protein
MKSYTKVIFNYRDVIFQTEDVHLGGGKYKDLRYWDSNRFWFIESKRGWGNFSKKDLTRIIENMDKIKKLLKGDLEVKDLEFKITFETKETSRYKHGELVTQVVQAPNPVQAVEKALMRSSLFQMDVIKTEISDPKNGDITDTSLAEINPAEDSPKKKTIKIKVKRKGGNEMSNVVTIKDLSEKFGVDQKRTRVIARKLGLKPNPTDVKGFGPKKKYEWPANAPEVQKLTAALAEEVAASKAEKK